MDEQIQVTALTNGQVCDIARVTLGPHPSLAGVPERICQRANGNPYYCEEAVQALIDEGHVEGERGSYRLVKPIEQWRIPDTVHALISARIDRLPEEPKGLLQFAAVIGQEFRPKLLANLAELESEPFESGLAALEESGFVHARDGSPELRYRFCHPLVQEVAYTTQLEAHRARAHARLAAALEADHPLTREPSEVSVQLAHHWERAGEWAKAGAWNVHAARWLAAHDITQTGVQFRQAIANFDRAPDSPDALKGRIASRAGLIRNTQFTSTPREEVERIFEQARDMAVKLGDLPLLAELHLAQANDLLHRGDAEEAVRLTTDAVNKVIAVGAGQMVHRFRLGVLLIFNTAGYPREGIDLVNRAAGTAWMTEPVHAENYLSRGFYGLMLATLGRLEEGERNARQAAEFADREDRSASWMYAGLVDIARLSGAEDVAQVMAEARKAVERAEAFGSPFFRTFALRALAQAHCMRGTPAEAIPLLEEQRVHVGPGGLGHQFEAGYLATLAECYLAAGRDVEAEKVAEEAIASGAGSGSRVWEIRALGAWLELPPTPARRARAGERLERQAALVELSGVESARPLLWLARAHWSESKEEAARYRREALEAFRRIGAEGHAKRLAGLI